LENRLAKIISFVFHPALMPTIGFAFLFMVQSPKINAYNDSFKYLFIGFVFFFSFILPVLFVLMYKYLGGTNSIYLTEKDERRLPLIFSIISLAFGFRLLSSTFSLDSFLLSVLLAGIFSLAITYVFNLFFKISLHLTAIGGIVGMLTISSNFLQVNLFVPISILIILSGVIAWARLKLKAHTNKEVYAGFFNGFVGYYLTVIILYKFFL
jgi:hypothetical protein